MLNELFKEFDGAFSDNTLRAYRADLQHYFQWCADQGVKAIPATDEVMSRYVMAMSETYKSASIQRRLDCLSSVFNLTGQPNPTNERNTKLACKKVYRSLGRAQQQAEPLRWEALQKMLAVCDESLMGQRNKLLLQLGYESMRRRAELVAFTFESRHSISDHQHALVLYRSKTDQLGRGTRVTISNHLNSMILDWQARIDAKEGPILRSVSRHGCVGNSLSDESLSRIIQRLQHQAGIQTERPFSGHSFRVGTALDLLDRGVPLYQIMLRGGWTSETSTLRYLRSWLPNPIDGFD